MNNNYKIIRTIFENVFQRVLECKDNDSGDVFYNNVITNQKVIDLVDIEGLNSLNSNILNCYKTEDRIFIVTKSFESLGLEGRSIKEYVSNNKLSLKQQFYISKKIIELSSNIFKLTDVVQQKILDLNKIYIDKKDNVIVDCNLIFEQEHDIRDNETFKRMGNILHYVFAGMEIVDYNISELVPPDMLKIIVRCLTKEYMHPKDVLSELNNSPIYNMINPNAINENKSKQNSITYGNVTPIILNKTDKKENILKESEEVEKLDSEIFDIYLNDNKIEDNENTKDNIDKKGIASYLTSKDIRRAVIPLVIIVFVLMIGNYIIKNHRNDVEDVSGKNTDVSQSSDNNKSSSEGMDKDVDGTGGVSDDVSEDNTDSTSRFFNKDLINSVGYTGTVAELDKDIYVEGKNSLVVKNDEDGKIKALFATVDFTNPEFSYMLKKQIAVAAKTKSESDVSALIVLEAYKDGNLASTFHTTVQIYNDMWSQNTIPINVTNADSLNIYVEFSGKNKVWIDSIYIDVVK